MITDTDITKMKKVFATKDDLKALAKQKDLLEVKKKLQELSDYAIPTLGNLFRWTDDIHTAVMGRKTRRTSEN